ncbi:TRAF-like superfamily protein [Raphanus sativus]|nr:TRAF-like superfamily protein [Raphanus sativus]
MGEQIEKRFSWVLKKFSSSQDEKCYSRPFAVAGVNWRLLAYPKGDKKDGHLSLYLEFEDPASLPPGWSREVKFTLALFTKAWGKSSIVLGGQCCFDAKNKAWGYTKFVSLAKLHDKSEGFLVNSRLIILAELHVLPAVVVPEETLKITEPLCNQADDESVGKSKRDSSCEETEDSDDDDGVSEEGSDDDDGPSDDGSFEEDVDSDDDASSPLSDDGGEDISLLNHFSALEEASHTVGNDGIKSNSGTAETEVSNDDAPKDNVDQVKSLEDASRASVYVTDNSLITKIQPTRETIAINGFDVFFSQVESVSYIFKRHPDIALDFRPKNEQIRRAYMNELLSLIEMMCQSPEKLSKDDLSNADDTLADLIDVGFKLDWLMIKLDEVSEKKKKKEKGSEARLRTMEEELLKLKLMFLDLETQMQMEKAEALAAIAPLSFDDIVC